MKLHSHYIRLRSAFRDLPEQDPVETTVGEIATALDCTHRNAVLLLGRMMERDWITWTPQRGRGNKSQLVFRIRSADMIAEIARELVEKKDLRGALEQMNVDSVPAAAREQFNEWLYGYFGHSTVVREKRKIDTLRFPLSQPFYTLDPAQLNYASEAHLAGQLFDGLVRHQGPEDELAPHLAHSWEANASRTIWTFYLRKGVLFHHGREMTADDVRYTLERLRRLNVRALYNWVLGAIDFVETPDPTVVRIRLRQPNELLLPFLAAGRAAIVPEDICGQLGERFGKAPVGTGPFKLVRNDPSMCVLEAFPPYFQGRAHLDQVEIWNIPDLYEQFRHKGLDDFQVIHNFRMPEGKEGEAWTQIKQQGTTCRFLTVNMLKDGPLSEASVRTAVCRAVNRSGIIAALNGDAIMPAAGFLAQDDAEDLPPEAAKSLLAAAGYRGQELELHTIPPYEQDAVLLQKVCREAGIRLRIRLLPLDEFKGEMRLRADLILFAIPLDHDLELRLIDLYKSMQRHLQPQTASRVAQQLAAVVAEPSRTGRAAMLAQLEGQLAADGAIRFLYRKHLKTAFHPSVAGISLDSLSWVRFRDIWFKSV